MLVGILVVVAIVSAAKAVTAKTTEDMITNWLEVALIVFVITLNAWIGIMQEGSAEKAADALKAMLSSDAEVIRDGANCQVPATELVPGDFVVIKLGDRIPADIRMIEVSNLACQEAALTGESLPIDKITDTIETSNPAEVPLGDRKNMCFSATLVSQGRGVGIVVATGDHTQIGTINALVNNVETKKTGVLLQIDRVSTCIAVFVVIVAIITFFVAFFMTGLETSGRCCHRARLRRGHDPRRSRVDRLPHLRLGRVEHGQAECHRPRSSIRRDVGSSDCDLQRQDWHPHQERNDANGICHVLRSLPVRH